MAVTPDLETSRDIGEIINDRVVTDADQFGPTDSDTTAHNGALAEIGQSVKIEENVIRHKSGAQDAGWTAVGSGSVRRMTLKRSLCSGPSVTMIFCGILKFSS